MIKNEDNLNIKNFCCCEACYLYAEMLILEDHLLEFLAIFPDEYLGLNYRIERTLKRLRLHKKEIKCEYEL